MRIRQLGVYALAAFTWIWVFVRAHVQSITIDEADTYLVWVGRQDPSYWISASNNHVLNSMLMKLSTSVFGLSHLSVRAPALLGAILYLSAAAFVAELLGGAGRLRYVFFLCLAWNPFVLDYLVAARGYSLAIGFSMWALAAVAVGVRGELSIGNGVRWCGVASACLGLAFASNFSFALFLGVCGLVLGLVYRRWLSPRLLAIWLVGPAFVLGFGIAGWTALHMPHEQLWYGAKTLGHTFVSLRTAIYDEPNAHLVNPMLLDAFGWLRRALPWALVGGVVLGLIWGRGSAAGWRGRFGYVCASILAASLLLHQIAFTFFRVLLPQDRTALFLAPLLFLVVGGFAMASSRAWVRPVLAAVLGLHAVLFASTMRLTWFREWKWNQDTREAYSAAAWYTSHCGAHEVATTWMFAPALNFYRKAYPEGQMLEVHASEHPSGEGKVFVMHPGYDFEFIKRQHLKIVYEGAEVVVSIHPELERACY